MLLALDRSFRIGPRISIDPTRSVAEDLEEVWRLPIWQIGSEPDSRCGWCKEIKDGDLPPDQRHQRRLSRLKTSY